MSLRSRLLITLCCSSLLNALSAQKSPGTPESTKKQEAPAFEIDYGDRKTRENCKIAKWGPTEFESPDYAIFAEKVVVVEGDPIHEGVVLVHKGKIQAVGKALEVQVPDGYRRVDCGSGWLVPGFVDLHCHIAGNGFDLNDMVHPTNPELRTVDLVGLHHSQIKTALQGGVTTVLYIPGSGSNMGGFGTLTKTAGRSVEEALIRFPGSLKIAQAGNPERRAGDMGAGRIGMNFGLRATLNRGREYYQAWEDFEAGKRKEKPDFDPSLEYLRGLFRHEYPVSVHTQGYQVCLQTLREMHDEFGLWVFIDHGTFNAYRMSEEALLRGVPVCNGPRQYQLDSDTGRMVGLAAMWVLGGKHGWRNKVRGVGPSGIAINTDSPVVPQEELTVQAAMAVRLGLPDAYAIRAITINPANFVGVGGRIGSLSEGKDADIACWTGDPLDPRSHLRKIWVNGSIYYDSDPGGKDFGKRQL
ncbi:MAG: amidohydrolase family protein [Planctomycetota bacterium]